MGARGTVEIRYDLKDEPNSVFLYTHYGVNEMLSDVKRALNRRKRWDDPAYLARIVFCEMMRNGYNNDTAAMEDSLSFGIQPYPAGDAEIEIRINFKFKTVEVNNKYVPKRSKTYTFEELVEEEE